MYLNVPDLLDDQTMDSYAAILCLSNGISCGMAAEGAAYGLFNKNKMNSLLLQGRGDFFKKISVGGYSSVDIFLERHSHFSLFRPFVDALEYEKYSKRMIEGCLSGVGTWLGLSCSSVFKTSYSYCPVCLNEDIISLGYAYPRRVHQVLGVIFCPAHGCRLEEFSSENEADFIRMWGVLIGRDESSVARKFQREPSCRPLSNCCIHRYGEWVAAAFNGDITVVPLSVRERLLSDRWLKIKSTHRVRGVDRYVSSVYPKDFLSEIGMSVYQGNKAHWPTNFLFERYYSQNPIANILLLSLMFDSYSAYNQEALAYTKDNSSLGMVLPRRRPSCMWNLGLLKDVLKNKSLMNVAIKHGVGLAALCRRIKSNPVLLARRKVVLRKIRVHRARKILLSEIKADSWVTRNVFRKKFKTAYADLVALDRDWFDKNFPAFSGCW